MLNKVMLIGNVGKDPETRTLESGNKVATFSMATTERYKDRQGQQQEKTEWHNIVVWGKLAELIEKYVKKGSKLYIEGKITTRKWQDKEGNDRYSTEIVASTSKFLSKAGGDGGGSQTSSSSSSSSSNTGQGSQTTSSSSSSSNTGQGSPLDNIDDDLPF